MSKFEKIYKDGSWKKGIKFIHGIPYIPWQVAVAGIQKHYESVSYEKLLNPITGSCVTDGMVGVAVSCDGVKHTEWYEVSDDFYNPLTHYTQKDINKAFQRALTKCIATFGYGLDLYLRPEKYQGASSGQNVVPMPSHEKKQTQPSSVADSAFANLAF